MPARRAGMSTEPAGAAAPPSSRAAVDEGLADRSESSVLLVTGRATAAGSPVDPSRVAVVETLDDVAGALGGDVLTSPVGRR